MFNSNILHDIMNMVIGMKEELLKKLKKEFIQKKIEINEYNKKVAEINELMKDEKVQKFLSLTEMEIEETKEKNLSDKEIISKIYPKYLYEIKENETNNIYIYLGTYMYSNEIDIVHGSNDTRVEYNSQNADYRTYLNLEHQFAKNIPIAQCPNFEKNNIIINPSTFFKTKAYYDIQKDFFYKATIENQEEAKKYILTKYKRLNK